MTQPLHFIQMPDVALQGFAHAPLPARCSGMLYPGSPIPSISSCIRGREPQRSACQAFAAGSRLVSCPTSTPGSSERTPHPACGSGTRLVSFFDFAAIPLRTRSAPESSRGSSGSSPAAPAACAFCDRARHGRPSVCCPLAGRAQNIDRNTRTASSRATSVLICVRSSILAMFHLFRKAQQIDSILREEIRAGTNSAVSGIFFPDANTPRSQWGKSPSIPLLQRGRLLPPLPPSSALRGGPVRNEPYMVAHPHGMRSRS
jgi:hypothetical protein